MKAIIKYTLFFLKGIIGLILIIGLGILGGLLWEAGFTILITWKFWAIVGGNLVVFGIWKMVDWITLKNPSLDFDANESNNLADNIQNLNNHFQNQ